MASISQAHGFASNLLHIPMSIHALKDGHIRGAAVSLGEEERGGQEAVCCGKDGLQKGSRTRGKVFAPTLRGCTSISIFLQDTAAPVLPSPQSRPSQGKGNVARSFQRDATSQ